MRRFIVLLAIGAASVIAGSAAAAPPTVQMLIRHQVNGCHSWAFAGGAYHAVQHLTAAPGTRIDFTNTDVMPHRLVQLSGPKVTLFTPNMHKPSARSSVQVFATGRYVFETKAGEDWVKGVETKGEDNVLKLIVIVK